jgi:hypothetical protein
MGLALWLVPKWRGIDDPNRLGVGKAFTTSLLVLGLAFILELPAIFALDRLFTPPAAGPAVRFTLVGIFLAAVIGFIWSRRKAFRHDAPVDWLAIAAIQFHFAFGLAALTVGGFGKGQEGLYVVWAVLWVACSVFTFLPYYQSLRRA